MAQQRSSVTLVLLRLHSSKEKFGALSTDVISMFSLYSQEVEDWVHV
jgi:hypothetical protein